MKLIGTRCLLPALLLFSMVHILWADTETLQAAEHLILMEAKLLAQERALRPPDPSLADINNVSGYLQTLDPYSSYISPEERHFLEDMDKPDYSGIGMEVIAGKDGRVYCIPFDTGPAHTAGVRSGDRLVAVDGQAVTAESLEILPSLVRGPAGTPVTLRVAGKDVSEREVIINRAALHRSAVEAKLYGDTFRIRIYRFEAETPELLHQALNAAKGHKKLIIDLRGNIGGELKAAVEAVGLLLPPNALIAKVLKRPGTEAKPVFHRNSGGENFLDWQIVIWQDQMTASASELFIAALIDNGRAINIGSQTFGKGLVQEVFPASNGGLFVITTGEIIPPGGRSFNDIGIKPYLPIGSSVNNTSEHELLRQTEAVFFISIIKQSLRYLSTEFLSLCRWLKRSRHLSQGITGCQ